MTEKTDTEYLIEIHSMLGGHEARITNVEDQQEIDRAYSIRNNKELKENMNAGFKGIEKKFSEAMTELMEKEIAPLKEGVETIESWAGKWKWGCAGVIGFCAFGVGIARFYDYIKSSLNLT